MALACGTVAGPVHLVVAPFVVALQLAAGTAAGVGGLETLVVATAVGALGGVA